jgi:ribosome assembly protein YihI (activator of Der GTPase)
MIEYCWQQEAYVANRTRPTLEKRAKERARQEKRKQKDERRAAVKAQRASNPRQEGEEDPDIAGIRPGPQPSPWGDEEQN